MRENQHLVSIPQEVLEQLKSKANELNTLLAPYALALTAEERRELPKMGEKTVSFVQKAHELAAANADLRPNYLNMAEFNTDMNDANGLLVVGNTTRQALETVSDIEMLAGSEAYQAALAFYNYVKLLATQDVPRARAIYEELKKRFPSRGKGKTNVDNAATE
ncbi:hypothetical protein FACS189452_05410 [Bacteroidia bacterium]|nr:hypothetical protein FACS189452_05410 [Bacteroidia bacterium]GHT82520.1 hypothetical protein FACS189467_7800 [Bacteroidia bacterium]